MNKKMINDERRKMAIQITLCNINSHAYSEYILEKDKIILIKGDSGIGKSSIFQAITWALYGKIKGLCKHGETKYYVKLVFPGYQILRQHKPNNLLQFTFSSLSDKNSKTDLRTDNDVKTGNDVKMDKILENEVAQEYINKIFGTEDIFLLTCYLEQDSRSDLLSGTNVERLDLIRKLSFWSDDPQTYLTKIDETIKLQEQNFQNNKVRYETEVAIISKRLVEKPIDHTCNLSEQQHLELKHNLDQLKQNIDKLKIDITTQNKLMGSIQILSSKLSNCHERRSKIRSESELKRDIMMVETGLLSDQRELQNCLDNREEEQLKQKLDQIQMELNRLNMEKQKHDLLKQQYEVAVKNKSEIIERYTFLQEMIQKHQDDYLGQINLTIQDYQRFYFEKDERDHWIRLCRMMNVEYSVSAIQLKLQEISQKLTDLNIHESNLKIEKTVNMYQNQIDAIPVSEASQDQVNQLEREVEAAKDSLECPHCHQSVKYKQGKLHLSTHPSDPALEQRLIELKQKLSGQIHRNNLIDQVKILSSMIKPCSYTDLNQMRMLQEQYEVLSKIRVLIEPPYPLDRLKLHFEYLHLQETLNNFDRRSIDQYDQIISGYAPTDPNLIQIENNLTAESNTLFVELNKMKIKRSSIMNQIQRRLDKSNSMKNELMIQLHQLETLSLEINSMEKELDNLKLQIQPGLEQDLKMLEGRLEQMIQMQNKAVYYREMMAINSELQKKYNQLNEQNYKLAGLYKLKQMAFDLECNQLQNTVDVINENLNAILAEIFEKPIRVLLQLYKKNKTNDKIKSNVNLFINYDGNEYDNINKLSGGEKDRVSYALTLALNRLNDSPLLMLDETLRSLNDAARTACMQALRSFPDRTVLCINHEDVEGNYDLTIDLNKSFR